MNPTIYLAGPMLSLTSEEMNEWRGKIVGQLSYKFNFINPARRIYEKITTKQIIELDKKEILLSDLILVNHLFPSDGTAMEIFFSYMNNIPVYTVTNNKEYSPWIEYHSTILFEDLEECINFLKNIYQLKENDK